MFSCSLAGCIYRTMHAKSKGSTGGQMKAQLRKMQKQLEVVWAQVEDYNEENSGKEEENGEGQRGKEKERRR